MQGASQFSDKELQKAVASRLVRGGGGAATASVQRGTVTVTGKLQYEAQRRQLLKLIGSISGVRSVIDQLSVSVKKAF
jgi:osmotically-inducible protein OsmY